MSFDDHFEASQTPEWHEFYLEYKKLRNHIKEIKKHSTLNHCLEASSNGKQKYKENESSPPRASIKDIKTELKPNEPDAENPDHHKVENPQKESHSEDEKFVREYAKKIKKIEEFFDHTMSELKTDFDLLKLVLPKGDSDNFDLKQMKTYRVGHPVFKHHNLTSKLLSALIHIYKITEWLEDYCKINALAGQKASDKFDKVTQKDRKLFENEKKLHFVSILDKDIELKKDILICISDYFFNGDQERARGFMNYKEFKFKLLHTIIISILLGLLFVFAIIFILVSYLPGKYLITLF